MMRSALSEADILALAIRAGIAPTPARLAELAEGAKHLAVMLNDLEGDHAWDAESALIFSAERGQ